MTTYSVQTGDQIFRASYGFLSFAKNMVKNIVKDLSKKLSDKYRQTILHNAKQSTTDVL